MCNFLSAETGTACKSKWLIIRRLRKRQTLLPVRLSVRSHVSSTRPTNGFSWNLIFLLSVAVCQHVPILIKIWPKEPVTLHLDLRMFTFSRHGYWERWCCLCGIREAKEIVSSIDTKCTLCVTNWVWRNNWALRIIDCKWLSTLRRYRLYISPHTISRQSIVNLLLMFR
jgi:hypothetical protein